MAKIKNQYNAKKKVAIVLEGLSYPDGIQAYCRNKGIRDGLFYSWKKQIQNNAENLFKKPDKPKSTEKKLKQKLDKKEEIISVLLEENITLKKNFGILT